jgi:hypothetical protein
MHIDHASDLKLDARDGWWLLAISVLPLVLQLAGALSPDYS